MPKKILFLHKCFVKSGGIERVHQNLANALLQQHAVTSFFVLNGFGESEEGFNALCLSQNAGRAPKNSGVLGKSSAVCLWIKNHEVDAIIAATEQANLIAFLCKLKYPKLNIVYTRHCAFDVSDQKLPPWIIKLLYSLYAINGNIVGVSRSLQEQIQNTLFYKKSSVYFVPNAVVDESIYIKSNENSEDWQFVNYFVAVGRLVEQKGVDLLIHAYARAFESDPTLPILAIVGEGEDKDALLSLIEKLGLVNKVFLSGFTSNPYYPIKNAVALILSSRHEGMPTVLVESMALDTPVIAFDCPTGPSELVISGQNGVLVPHLDVAALADAILSYKKLPTENIRQYAVDFDFPNVARAYLKLCEGSN
jgi:glycosyltransferase involved in cell wall biosynthesis